jgi:hypothetical protein
MAPKRLTEALSGRPSLERRNLKWRRHAITLKGRDGGRIFLLAHVLRGDPAILMAWQKSISRLL